MATLVSLDDQRIWAPPKHNSAQESFSKPSSCKQQELSLQDRTARSPQDGFVLPGSSSNDAIIISSDEESDTDNEDDGVNDTLQTSPPCKSHSSVAGHDAGSDPCGEWDESYCGPIDEACLQPPGTVDDHTVASLPAAEQDSVRTGVISPASSGSVAHDSMEIPFSQFASVPQTSGYSGEMARERTNSFVAALGSDDELCPSHQVETRGATLLNHNDFVDDSDNADASVNVRKAGKSSPMLLHPGARSFDHAAVRNKIQEGKFSNGSIDEAQDSMDSQGCHTVESETQRLEEVQFLEATMDNAEGRTRTPNICDGRKKRRRRKAREPADEGSDSDDEFIPTRKLRKASSHHQKRNPSRFRKSKRCVTESQAKNHGKISGIKDHNLDTTIASYEEWLLSDAVLKCIRDNGTMTFQMQFTHTTSPCGIHTKHPQKTTNESPKYTDQPQSHIIKPKGCRLFKKQSLTPKQDVLTHQASPNDSDDTGIYKAELLARWGKSLFFLRWDVDGSTGWEPRRNILDKKMLRNFESTYTGFDEGVDVLDTRKSKCGKRQYLLHFHGRPQSEDFWVSKDLLSSTLLESVVQTGLHSN